MVPMPFISDQQANAKRLVELHVAKHIRSFPSSSKEMA